MLPHFQQPGQAYFVTWNLKDAVPPKALKSYSLKLESLKNQIHLFETLKPEQEKINQLKLQYHLVRKKYMKAYDDLLDLERNPSINLSHIENTEVLKQTLLFWEGKKLTNFAFTIMPNHVHWVFQLFEKNSLGEPVYLQDIMHSVKLFSANKINRMEQKEGSLWQKESFDTTIRDDKHLYFAIRYTINNPVKAGLISDWRLWNGTWIQQSLLYDY